MNVKEFIKKRPSLVWYVKDTDDLSESSIIEHVLNYGNFNDFKELVNIMSVGKVAEIFRKQISKERNNYRPEVKNYFTLYFNKYAPRDSR